MIKNKKDLIEYINADKIANNYRNKFVFVEKLKGNIENAHIMQLLITLRKFEFASNNRNSFIGKYVIFITKEHISN